MDPGAPPDEHRAEPGPNRGRTGQGPAEGPSRNTAQPCGSLFLITCQGRKAVSGLGDPHTHTRARDPAHTNTHVRPHTHRGRAPSRDQGSTAADDQAVKLGPVPVI